MLLLAKLLLVLEDKWILGKHTPTKISRKENMLLFHVLFFIFYFQWFLTLKYWGGTCQFQDMLLYYDGCKPHETLLCPPNMQWDAFPLFAISLCPLYQLLCSTAFCLFLSVSPFVPDEAGRPSLWFSIWLCLDVASLCMGGRALCCHPEAFHKAEHRGNAMDSHQGFTVLFCTAGLTRIAPFSSAGLALYRT